MTRIIIAITAALLSLVARAQVSENRNVADFSKLKASTSVAVSYTISNTKSVKVETDDSEKLQLVKTEVEDGTLKIFVDTGEQGYKTSRKGKKRVNNVSFNTLKVTVTGPSLKGFKASSSAEIKVENLNTTENLEIGVSSSASISGKFKAELASVDVSSSADFKGNVEAKTVSLESSSSAEIIISGKAEKVSVKASSSSSCKAKDLIAETADVKASSSADVSVYVSKSIDAKASSSADIAFYGNPAQVIADKSSSGSVTSH